MATMEKLIVLLLISSVYSLTSEEELRLIMNSDSSVIDEKIKELPGGILLPPEVRNLPMPTMEPALPQIKFDKVSQVRVMPRVDRIKSVMKSMKERLTHRRLYTPQTHHRSLTSSSQTQPNFNTSPISTLEMSMKRIEILASRAGFNMSSIPRRSQLQIVTKLADKLPLKLSEVVKTALRTNDLKIYEYLPEPSRDPLIEDNPEFLSHFVDVKDEEEFFDPSDFRDEKKADMSKISLTTDGEPPVSFDDNDFDNTDLAFMSVPQNNHPFLPKPSALVKLEDDKDKINRLQEKLDLLEEKLEKSKSDNIKVNEDMETQSSQDSIVIQRDPKTFTSSENNSRHPIRVSIISKDTIPTITTTELPTTTTTTEKSLKTQTKYVQVQPLTSLSQTSISEPKKQLLFQVEKPVESSELNDYDLSEDEITAMVAELKKYENDNSVESLVKPHPLEFPDHPDHPQDLTDDYIEELIKNNTHNNQWRPINNKPNVPLHHFHGPPGPGHHMVRPPMMMRPFGPPRPHPGPPPRPVLRINDVKVSEMPKNFNKECDYFSNEICLLVQDYPIEAISESIERNPELALSLLPREEEEKPFETSNNKLSSEGGFLCPSKVAYGKIKKAKSNTNGKWKFVVNYGDKTQTLRIEKCLTPGDKCSYVMPHYRTACTQVYNYHRLLAWDSDNGLHIDVFKVPTCCTCHVQGYYSKSSQSPTQSPVTPVTRRRMMLPQQQGPIMFHHPVPRFGRHQLPKIIPTAQQNLIKQEENNNDDDLNELLKQYSTLKDKIAKKKSTTSSTTTTTRSDRMLKKLNLIETVLMRKKRKNSSNQIKKSQQLKQLLKKLSEKNLDKKTLISIAKKHLSNSKTNRRMGRNLKNIKNNELKSKVKSTKHSSKRRTLALLLTRALKQKKNNQNKKLIPLSRRLKEDKVNYSYHPIMDYYGRRL